jgi:uncharacterized protein YjiS (DUF1127 family)
MSTTTLSSARAIPSSRSLMLDAFNTALALWSRRKTEMLLADLDDHILRDIGVNPSEMRRPRNEIRDWVIDGRAGPARLVFIGH